MATRLAIAEYQDALIVTGTHTPSLRDRLLLVVGAGGVLAVVWFMFQDVVWIVPVAAALIVVSGFLGMRRTKVELRVTESEIVSEGRIGDSLARTRSAVPSEVESFNYIHESRSAEGSREPSGLYARVRQQSLANAADAATPDRFTQALQNLSSANAAPVYTDICLLPHLDEVQTRDVIDRIAIKFPALHGLRPARPAAQ